MRSYPSCWNKTLAQLGFRRKRRKPSKAQDIHKRRSLFEMLEQRQMLSGDPLLDLSSDEIIVAAATTEQPIQLIANKPVFVLIQPEIPEEELLSLPEHERDEVEPVFVVETVETKDGPKAIISLNPNNAVGPPSALQRLTLELHQNDQVVQSYDILIDIAEEDFREEFLADRIDKIEVQSEARSLGEVKQPINRTATAEEIAQATEYWNTFIGPKTLAQEQSMSLLFDATPQVQVGKAEVSTEDLVSIAKGRGRNDQLFRNTRDNKEFYSEVEKQTEKLKQDRQAATTDAERESVAEQERSLRKLTLVLAKDLREDLKSTDSELAQSAQKVRDELVAISDPEELLFVGLGVDNEVQRKTNSQGDEKALSFIETGRYAFDELLEIDLGDHPAMVQVTKSSNLRTAQATSVSESPAVQDGSIDEANDGVNGGTATSLHVDGTVGSIEETLIRFSLDDFSDPTTISSASLQLSEIASGVGDAQIYVWNGLLAGSTDSVTEWNETNLSWIHVEDGLELSQHVSEFTQLSDWTAGTTTEIDVTDQIQRALLYGDANGDGVFGAAGMDGDIEAFHLAVTNWDAYVAEYGPRANSAADLLNRTDGGLGDGAIDTGDIADFFRRHGYSQGDYNLDGTVQDNQDSGLDGLDWAIFNANYGLSNARFTQGDGNFDGVVDNDDYNIWFNRKNEDTVVAEEPEIIVWVRPEDSTTDIEFAAQEHATLDGPTLVVTEQPDLALNKFSVEGSNLVVDYAVLGDTFTDVKVQLYQVGAPDILLHETAVQSGSLGSHEVLIATSVLSSIVEGDSIYAKVVGTPSSGAQANLSNDQLDFEFSTASTQTVNSLDDAGMDTLLRETHTLRELLAANESLGWFDTLSFDESLFGAEQSKITLGDHTGDGVADRIVIDQDILVAGPGPQSLVIDARDQTQGILIDTAAVVTLSGLGVTQGYAIGHGAGIYNKGDLTLERISITDSNAQSHGGGIYNFQGATLDIRQSAMDNNSGYHGGGISGFFDVGQSLSIDQSTISNNTSSNHSGGLSIVGTAGATPVEVLIVNSTFSGNESGTSAGAIRAQTNTELTIIHSTIVDNSAVSSAGGIYSHTGATTTLHNSILADNSITANAPWASDASGPIGGTTAEPSSGNLIGIGQAGHQMDGNTNTVGTSSSPIDPGLAPLANIGGPTLTHVPLSTSVAIGAANAGHVQATDQTGFAAISGTNTTAGSVSDDYALEVNTNADRDIEEGQRSLRQAFELAYLTGQAAVQLAPQVGSSFELVQGAMLVDGNVSVTGPGADKLEIVSHAFYSQQPSSGALIIGSRLGGVFDTFENVKIVGSDPAALVIVVGGDVTLRNFEITGNQTGAGIRQIGGILTVEGSTISENVQGIFNQSGTLTLNETTVVDNVNETGSGGGIYAGLGSDITVLNSTISGNSAEYGGGIYAPLFDESGGPADVKVTNSTVSNNTAENRGGGIYARGVDVTLTNATIANNLGEGGGVFAAPYTRDTGTTGKLTANNTIIAGNRTADGTANSDVAGNLDFHSSSSHNLIGTPTTLNEANGLDNAVAGNIVGDGFGGPRDAKLGPLDYYGGSTKTHELLPGSPAIDAGLESLAVYKLPNGPPLQLTTDQRGFERVFDSGDAGPTGGLVDIGATEYDTYIGFGDLNGDGRTDRIGFDLRSNRINAVLDYGSHFASEYWEDLANTGDWTEFHTGDFNGDGRDDLIAFDDNVDQWTIAVSDSTQFSVSDVKTRSGEIITTNWGQIHIGDFDGDGSHELIGRTDVSSNWQFLDYDERLGATFQSDFGSTLESGFSAWYVGDVNRDGRDDLIAKRNSGGWNVALSELNGNSFRLGGSSPWTNWFENYLVNDVPDVDAPYQKVIDEFSWVYNNVELELYRGFLKGPEGAYQTKAANPFDQSALLVNRLEAAGFDADIAIGRIQAPFETVRDWIGAPPTLLAGLQRIHFPGPPPANQDITGVTAILQEAFDPNATHIPVANSKGKLEFEHAWVKVSIPTASGLVEVDLDPSWKFKDRQPGIYASWSHAFGGGGDGQGNYAMYSDDPTLASAETVAALWNAPAIAGTYSQFVPQYFGNILSQRSPVEDFIYRLGEELPAFTEHESDFGADRFPITSSVADIPYDGPVITREFSRIPAGLGDDVALVSILSPNDNYDNLDDLIDDTTPVSGGATAKDLWTHRVDIEVSGAGTTGFLFSQEVVTAQDARRQITIDYSAATPTLNLGYLPTDIEVAQGATQNISVSNGSLASEEDLEVTVKTFQPGQQSSADPGAAATETATYRRYMDTTSSVDTLVAIGINAHQFSTSRVGDLQDNLLAEVSTADADDIDDLLAYTIQKYWYDFNKSREDFADLSNFAQITHHAEVGLISAEDRFNASDIAPFGLVPQDVAMDIRTTGTMAHNWTTGLRSGQSSWVTGLEGSYLEHSVVEEVTGQVAISTMKGLQRAYESIGGIDGTGAPPSGNDFDEIYIYSLTDVGIIKRDFLRFNGDNFIIIRDNNTDGSEEMRFSRTGIKDVLKGKNTISVDGFVSQLENDHLKGHDLTPSDTDDALPIAQAIADIFNPPASSPQPTIGTTVLVPKYRTHIEGWTGSVFAANIVTSGAEASRSFDFVVLPDNGPAPVNGGISTGASIDLSATPAPGNNSFHPVVGSVNAANGNASLQSADILFPNVGIPLDFTRVYNSQAELTVDSDAAQPEKLPINVDLGIGWTHSFSDRLIVDDQGEGGATNPDLIWLTSRGERLAFDYSTSSGGGYVNPKQLFGTFEITGTGYRYLEQDGMEYHFEKAALSGSGTNGAFVPGDVFARLEKKIDLIENGFEVSYSGTSSTQIAAVSDTHTTLRQLIFSYDPLNGYIESVEKRDIDPANNSNSVSIGTWRYAYDAVQYVDNAGNTIVDDMLTAAHSPTPNETYASFAEAASSIVEYEYYGQQGLSSLGPKSAWGKVRQVRDPNETSNSGTGIVQEYEYYHNKRVASVTHADGSRRSFTYNLARNETQVVDENGHIESFLYQSNGLLRRHILEDRTSRELYWGVRDRNIVTDPPSSKSPDEDIWKFVPIKIGTDYLLQGSLEPTGAFYFNEYYDSPLDSRFGKVKSTKAAMRINRADRYLNGGAFDEDFILEDGIVTEYAYSNATGSGKSHILLTDSITVDPSGPDQIVTQFEYRSDGRLKRTIDPIGRRTDFGYRGLGANADAGLLNSIVSPIGIADDNDYRSFARLGTFTITGEALTVRLSASTSSGAKLAADAARIIPIDLATKRLGDFANTQIIENESPSGFSISGNGVDTRDSTYTSNGIFGNSVAVVNGDDDGVATWEFTDLVPGSYVVAVSLANSGSNSQFAQYEVLDGLVADSPTRLGDPINLNQTNQPADYHLGQQSFFQDNAGNTTRVRQEGFELETNEYDSNGNMTSAVDATGRQTVSTYDVLGRLRSTQQIDSFALLEPNLTTFEYDANGQLQAEIDPLGNQTLFNYDRRGRLIETQFADNTSVGSAYDGVGNVLTQTDELGNTFQFVYDSRDRQVQSVSPEGAVSRTSYGGSGGVVKSTDPLLAPTDSLGLPSDLVGNSTTFTYDVAGRLLESTNAVGDIATNRYDSLGRLEEATDYRENKTYFTYDKLDRVVTTRSFGGSTSAPPIGLTTTEYDLNGNVTEVGVYDVYNASSAILLGDSNELIKSKFLPADRQISTVNYDSFNRPIIATNADGTSTETVYDAAGRMRFSYDELGRPTEWRYDAFGRLERVLLSDDNSLAINNDSPETVFHYDVASNLIAVTNANGDTASNIYDARNRVISSTNAEAETSRYVYDASSRLVSSVNPLGAATFSTFDGLGRLVLARSADPDGNGQRTAAENRFVYDAVGNVVQSAGPSGAITQFEYDELNRLHKETIPATLIADNVNSPGIETGFTVAAESAGRLPVSDADSAFGRDYIDLERTTPALPTANWKLSKVPAGTYRVAITWLADENTALDSNARIDVRIDGGAYTPQITEIDQNTIPGDVTLDHQGIWSSWKQSEQSFVVPEGAEVDVRLIGGSFTAKIRADAVMLERVDASYAYTYDENSNLESVTDTRGFKTQYEYDSLDRLQLTTLPDPNDASNLNPTAQTVKQIYDGYGNVVDIIENRGGVPHVRTTKLVYDKRNRLTDEYFAFGAPDVVRNHYKYDDVGNLSIVRQSYDDAATHTTTQVDYDNLNRPIIERQYPAFAQGNWNARTRYSYDKIGNLTKQIEQVREIPSVEVGNSQTVYEYDDASRLVSIESDKLNEFGGELAKTSYAYDEAGNLTQQTDPTSRITTHAYDRLNQLTQTTFPDPDAVGSGDDAPFTQFEYDVAGNVVAQSNLADEVNRFVYDALGQILIAVLPDSTETQYRYDSAGNLIEIRDANHNITSYEYDGFNRRTLDTNQLGNSRSYTYNDQGNLAKIIDRNGRRRDFTYDSLDRPIREEWWNTTADDTVLTIDKLDHYLEWEYDKLGRVVATGDVPIETTTPVNSTSVSAAIFASPQSYRETFQYDYLGRLTQQTNYDKDRFIDGVSGDKWTDITSSPLAKQTFVYDQINLANPNDWYSTITTQEVGLNDGSFSLTKVADTTRTYDLLGRLTQIDEPNAGLTLGIHDKTIDFAYQKNGLLQSINRVANRGNLAGGTDFLLDTTYGYDGTGRIDSISHARSGNTNPFVTFGYTYDSASRIDEIVSEFKYSSVNFSRTQALAFDPNGTGQIVNETTTFAAGAVGEPSSINDIYAHDDNGNRTDLNSNAISVGVNNQTNEDSDYRYYYDREGNLLRKVDKVTKETTEYTWDYRNRLVEVREFGGEAFDFAAAAASGALVDYFNQPGTGETILNDGATLRLENQTISKALDLQALLGSKYTVTANTILEFDYTSDQQGTWGGVLFDNDTSFVNSPEWFFQVFGTNTDAVYLNYQDGFEEYIQSDGTKHFRIHLGSFYDPTKLIPYRYLVFRNAALPIVGTSEFSNVRLYEETATSQQSGERLGILNQTKYRYNADDLVVRKEQVESPHAGVEVLFDSSIISDYADTGGTSWTISSNGSTIEIDGDTEIAIDLTALNGGDAYQLTADTIVEFDFSSTDQSQVNGFMFDNQTAVWTWQGRQFNIYGHQANVGVANPPQYTGGGTAQSFSIRIGDYLSSGNIEPYRYLILNNRNKLAGGGNNTGNSTFSNFRIYEQGAVDPIAREDAKVEHYVYSGSHLAMVLGDNAKLKNRYTYAPGTDNLLVDEVFNAAGNESETLWAVTDHLGTVHDLIDGSNHNLVEHRDYDAFGNLERVVDSGNNPVEFDDLATDYAFAGRNWDNDIELYYNRARWYDSSQGKFISTDPIDFSGGDANLYRYTGNNPTNYRDPSGNFEEDAQVFVSGNSGGGGNGGGSSPGLGILANSNGPDRNEIAERDRQVQQLNRNKINNRTSSALQNRRSVQPLSLSSVPVGRIDALVNDGLALRDGKFVAFADRIGNEVVTIVFKYVPSISRQRGRSQSKPFFRAVRVGSIPISVATVDGVRANSQSFIDIARSDIENGRLRSHEARLTFALHLLPTGAAADFASQREFSKAVVALAGDAAGGLGRIGQLTVKGRHLIKTASAANNFRKAGLAIEGSIAALRLGQGASAGLQGESSLAAGHVGEAFLRLFGVRSGLRNAPTRLASSNSASTGVARLDRLAVESAQYGRFKSALEARGVRVIENGSLVDDFAMAQSRVNGGVRELLVDPSKTRYVDVLHEWRHIRQFEQAGTTLQQVPGRYRGFIERGLEAGALNYEYRLSNILSRRQGTALSSEYLGETLYRAEQLNRTYFQKLHRSPGLQGYDAQFPFK